LQLPGMAARLSGAGHMTARGDIEILIVEDRQVMLKIIRRLLLQLGYAHIDEAANGLQAIAKIHGKRYDLIRSEPASRDTPFVLVTAESKPENILAAKAAGATGYLVKPFKLDVLEKTLDSVMARTGFVSLTTAA
jgi:two-component system, chemotaxis family, chemotaxis protein CheY